MTHKGFIPHFLLFWISGFVSENKIDIKENKTVSPCSLDIFQLCYKAEKKKGKAMFYFALLLCLRVYLLFIPPLYYYKYYKLKRLTLQEMKSS